MHFVQIQARGRTRGGWGREGGGATFDARSSRVSRIHPGYCTLEPFSPAPKCPRRYLSDLTNGPNTHILIPRSSRVKKKEENLGVFLPPLAPRPALFLVHLFIAIFARYARQWFKWRAEADLKLYAIIDTRGCDQCEVNSYLGYQRRPVKGFILFKVELLRDLCRTHTREGYRIATFKQDCI